MPLIQIVVVLIVVGVLMWLANTQLGQYMAAPYLKLLNIVVIIAVVLWLLWIFMGFFGGWHGGPWIGPRR